MQILFCIVVLLNRCFSSSATITHKILTSSTPSYLSDLPVLYALFRLLRSISADLLTVLRMKVVFSSCDLHVCAPTVYNNLDNTPLVNLNDILTHTPILNSLSHCPLVSPSMCPDSFFIQVTYLITYYI